MDIFNINFTGNLTADAKTSSFDESGKKVYNFTIACNVTEKNTLFLDVGYWLKEEADAENKLFQALKKGTSVTIFSDYASMKTSLNEKNNTNYESLNISAKRIKL